MKKTLILLSTSLLVATFTTTIQAQETTEATTTTEETTTVEETTLAPEIELETEFVSLTNEYFKNLNQLFSDSETMTETNTTEESTTETEVEGELKNKNAPMLDYTAKVLKYFSDVKEAETFNTMVQSLGEQSPTLKDKVNELSDDDREYLENFAIDYFEKATQLFYDNDELKEEVTPEQSEVAWKGLLVAKEYQFIQTDDDKIKTIHLDLAQSEYKRLLLSNFNEEGGFAEKLYSKHMLILYNILKDERPDFVAKYKDQQDKVLAEIEARTKLEEIIKKAEEKQSRGESLTDQEMTEINSALDEIDNNNSDYRPPVIPSKPNNTNSNSNSSSNNPTSTEVPVTTQAPVTTQTPTVTEPPVTVPQVTEPPVTEPPVTEPPVTQAPSTMEYAGHFATYAEADNYARNNIDWNRHRSWFISGSDDFGYDLYFETGY